MNDNEEWRAVAGYEGFYEVSNLGRVRSVGRHVRGSASGSTQWRPGKIRSCSIDHTSTGYRYVSLSRLGVVKKCNVHVLVLEAFVSARPSANHEACHNDGDRANAALSNLRWDTASGNKADELRHGTRLIGEMANNAKLTTETALWALESTQSSIEAARALGVASSTVRAVRLGQNWGKAAATRRKNAASLPSAGCC